MISLCTFLCSVSRSEASSDYDEQSDLMTANTHISSGLAGFISLEFSYFVCGNYIVLHPVRICGGGGGRGIVCDFHEQVYNLDKRPQRVKPLSPPAN